jgi:NDP-sugar pyrophosphorylase family protein
LYIGAIVTIAGAGDTGEPWNEYALSLSPASKLVDRHPMSCWEVVGRSIVDHVLMRLQDFGVQHTSMISEEPIAPAYRSSHVDGSGGKFWPAWERAVAEHLNRGAQALLLLRLGTYAEVDVLDLVRFHRERSSPLTQVQGKEGPLDFVIVDTAHLRRGTGSLRSQFGAVLRHRHHYMFKGYTSRLKTHADFRRLAKDALLGRNAIRPVGDEIQAGVWLGQGARVDSTVHLQAPAYVGAHTTVKGACTIIGASTIERLCKVDFGTTIDGSCIFPGTYLGMGLNVRRSIVAGRKLFHLDRNVTVEIRDSRLLDTASRFAREALLSRAKPFVMRPEPGAIEGMASTNLSRLASVWKSFDLFI